MRALSGSGEPVRCLAHAGQLVMPWRSSGGLFQFAQVGTRDARVFVGPLADVVERETTCQALAALDAPALAPDARAFVAAVYLDDLAWLQRVPVGSTVRIARRGKMTVDVAGDREWFLADADGWARQQRAAGFLPVLVSLPAERFRVLAFAWRGSLAVVDLDDVLRRVRSAPGCESVLSVEVL